jgi:hypothetical protein
MLICSCLRNDNDAFSFVTDADGARMLWGLICIAAENSPGESWQISVWDRGISVDPRQPGRRLPRLVGGTAVQIVRADVIPDTKGVAARIRIKEPLT